MDKRLIILGFLLGIAIIILAFPEGFAAVIVALLCSLIVAFVIRRESPEDFTFLIQLFLIALFVRLAFGLVVHIFDLRVFFGDDATLYDRMGQGLSETWFGQETKTSVYVREKIAASPSGWGMYYLVGMIYSVVGKNILAAQTFCGVIGAATVPMVYSCARKIFNNRQVGKISALMVAIFPAFIIWSSQLLKDGLMIFLLVLAMTLILRLQQKLNFIDILLLGLSLFGIITLRFYIFYMAALAIIGAFVIGASGSPGSMARRIFALVVIGVGLTYFGVTKNSQKDIEQYANLERIQLSRKDLAQSAESGYGEDIDVSTTSGAIAALPVGMTYLLLAPFPWQMTNLRQLTTLPDVILWWSSIPFLIIGLMYSIRNRLRSSMPILIFSLMLTLAYSIFLGNVGTAYRQRTQIQVFLFMFIAAGWVVRQEKRENKKYLESIKQQRFRERLKIGNSINLKKV